MYDHYDIETESMAIVASDLTIRQKMYWPQICRGIRERVAMFLCGRQQAPDWIRKELKDYEDLLDIRWDFQRRQWIIERYVRRDRAWVPVLEWEDRLDNRIIETLREGDTWRFDSPEKYLAYKHEQSARKRARNRAAADEKVLAAVDGLGSRQVEQFMEVERAFRTGETVVLAGQDAVAYERMTKGHLKAAERGETIDLSKAKILYGSRFSKRIH